MTTEDDFHLMLDKSLNDWNTRRILSDWLQDKGDRRAMGYAAMALHKRPKKRMTGWQWWDGSSENPPTGCDDLPSEWSYQSYPKRREAEDAAANAFADLPIERQQELLNGVMV